MVGGGGWKIWARGDADCDGESHGAGNGSGWWRRGSELEYERRELWGDGWEWVWVCGRDGLNGAYVECELWVVKGGVQEF